MPDPRRTIEGKGVMRTHAIEHDRLLAAGGRSHAGRCADATSLTELRRSG